MVGMNFQLCQVQQIIFNWIVLLILSLGLGFLYLSFLVGVWFRLRQAIGGTCCGTYLVFFALLLRYYAAKEVMNCLHAGSIKAVHEFSAYRCYYATEGFLTIGGFLRVGGAAFVVLPLTCFIGVGIFFSTLRQP